MCADIIIAGHSEYRTLDITCGYFSMLTEDYYHPVEPLRYTSDARIPRTKNTLLIGVDNFSGNDRKILLSWQSNSIRIESGIER